ncbi:MAG: type I-E CRISPR-associated protein Cas6/Cse3/CasE [Dehalococcoidia bacterium]
MYLSRLMLDPRTRQVRRDLADCQDLHRTLLSAWPQVDGPLGVRAECGLLYRVERYPRANEVSIFVQTRDVPDWRRLPDGYVICHEMKQVDAAYQGLRPGMRLRFRLRANPTRRIAKARTKEEERWVGKRVDLRKEEEQIAWLERKGREQCGFELGRSRVGDDIANVRTQSEDRSLGRKGDAKVTLASVLFEGELEITDITHFRLALEKGIGSGKAYGFGLLSIAPSKGMNS